MTKPPVKKLHFAQAATIAEPLEGGGLRLRSPLDLLPHASQLGEMLQKWATLAPSRLFLAERTEGSGFRRLTYAEVAECASSIAAALLERDVSPERPILVLSENSIDHALLMLGAMQAGVPVVPVSPAYSLMSRDFAKLRYIAGLVTPGVVFAADGRKFEGALRALDLSGIEVITSRNPPEGLPSTPFADLLAAKPSAAVEKAFAGVGPDTVAKILFTSGSTGLPKGVLNTQRMLCSNQQAIAQVWPFLESRPPVVVDWLPWSHTFGGNHNFNMILWHGGTLYIDEGKPAPGLIEKTVANLREISPTLYFNVPRGFDMLLSHLERDTDLANAFFRDLDLVFYAGAALPQNLWERLEQASIRARGERVVMVSAWGSTETAPMVTTVHFEIDRAGVIGLPAPGITVKLVPNGSKLELRVKGPNVTPGYFRRDDLTRAAFDEEGYYCIGDAGKLVDPADPARGIAFDGRVAEDFKLTSGTWVHVGALRVQVIAAGAPLIQDAVITGHDRDEVGLLIFPNPAALSALCPDAPGAPLGDLVRRPEVRDKLARALAAHNAEHPASSTCVKRAILLSTPPSIDENEITDKGYINQRAVLECRAVLVEKLYGGGGDPDVILIL